MRKQISLVIVLSLALAVLPVTAQVPQTGLRLWFRADTLTTIVNGAVAAWGSLVGKYTAVAQPGTGLTPDVIGGKPAIAFANSAYFSAPSIFPVRRDYTMYIVFKWNGVHAANNLVSGVNRAFFTSAPGVTSVLHSGDFGRLSTSSRALSGPTVLRVRHASQSGRTSISLNNEKSSDDEIPQNIDSVVFIGAYAASNGLNGSIAEILIFDRALTSSEELSVETYLHGRYTIARVADPPAPVVEFLEAPRSLEVVDPARGLSVRGVIISDSLTELTVDVLRGGKSIGTRTFVMPKRGDTIAYSMPAKQELVAYEVNVTAKRLGRPQADTILRATDIASGIVFTVTGQSNSIFGDASLPVSTWARTFGGNFSQSKADTVYSRSTASGNGGRNNVGAWALGLQNAIADQLQTPSLCISGGVGGTRIEQHLPDVNNRLNLATIYGSWLYRVIKSGNRERIRWLFWYQGESNHDEDFYSTHFDNLRAAWKKDLPNLSYIVVVQIRPGCAGPRHAFLRDEQRRLETAYPDVIVLAASGLPGHDGCHYAGVGYATLARQLFDVYQRNELSMQPGRYSPAPKVITASERSREPYRVVSLSFTNASELMMTSDAIIGGQMRTSREAWFANNQTKLHPLAVSVDPERSVVELTFSRDTVVRTISYVPDYTYDDGTTVFQGPWLMTRAGVGALSFHNVPVQQLSVDDYDPHSGSFTGKLLRIVDLTGRIVGVTPDDLDRIPAGMYIVVYEQATRKICIVR